MPTCLFIKRLILKPGEALGATVTGEQSSSGKNLKQASSLWERIFVWNQFGACAFAR
jgi:hypothetical protein